MYVYVCLCMFMFHVDAGQSLKVQKSNVVFSLAGCWWSIAKFDLIARRNRIPRCSQLLRILVSYVIGKKILRINSSCNMLHLVINSSGMSQLCLALFVIALR